MIALIQRVTKAGVEVDDEIIGRIDCGIVGLIGVEKDDSDREADRLLDRILGYRIFEDEDGRMNLSLQDVGGGLLLVPQFTLAADTRKGMRPSFTPAASPEDGQRLFEYLRERAAQRHELVASGRFGANMQVHLTNDGPVTFWLHVRP